MATSLVHPGSSEEPSDPFFAKHTTESQPTSIAYQPAAAFSQFTKESEFEKLKKFIVDIPIGPDEEATEPINKMIADITYVRDSFEKFMLTTGTIAGLNSDPKIIELLTLLSTFMSRGSKLFEDKVNLDHLVQLIAKIKLRVPRAPESSSLDKPKSGDRNATKNQLAFLVDPRDKIEDALRIEMCRHLDRLFWGLKGLESSYRSLNVREKLCLLSFAIFPWHEQRMEIKKRVLFYWWVGERFIDPIEGESNTIEKIGDEILKLLTDAGFVEPVVKKGLVSNNYRMHPAVRSLVALLARRAGMFDLNVKGEVLPEYDRSKRVVLIKSKGHGFDSTMQTLIKQDKNGPKQILKNMEPIQSLFNIDESIIDLETEWFSKMKYLSVLHLGRWCQMPKQHIEVKNAKSLDDVKVMSQLRLFSLQGVSTILKLPDSLCELVNLIILDLRACHNLEELPAKIGSLVNLTHLDVSDCHLMIYMPKELSTLSKLQVLKGFAISYSPDEHVKEDICTLADLSKLECLRKLSVFVKREQPFPSAGELQDFEGLKAVRKLKLSWEMIVKENEGNTAGDGSKGKGVAEADGSKGQGVAEADGSKTGDAPVVATSTSAEAPSKCSHGCAKCWGNKNENITDPDTLGLPKQLEKLDLWCMPLFNEKQLTPMLDKKQPTPVPDKQPIPWPVKKQPTWLAPSKLDNLKKLYIRGGELGGLEFKGENMRWNVETLRLKFLPHLELSWENIDVMFPKLTYLERYRCPKLAFFPCDEDGVWRRSDWEL